MNKGLFDAVSKELQRFSELMENKNIPLDAARGKESADIVAREFRAFFDLPCPITLPDSTNLLNKVKYTNVYLRRGLEQECDMRGLWHVKKRTIEIFVDASRPEASRIKTLVHEIIEPLLIIGYRPTWPMRPPKQKAVEDWANRFAAMLKMPPETFVRDATDCGLDLPYLKDKYCDTLAGVSRQVRDLVMLKRVFYFARFDIVKNVRSQCPGLIQVAKESSGQCVHIRDVAKTIRLSACADGLPFVNLAALHHYRVINPLLADLTSRRQPIIVEHMIASEGYEGRSLKLFEDYFITAILFAYGFSKTQGFCMVAVEDSDYAMIQASVRAMNCTARPDIRWIFSHASDSFDKCPDDKPKQHSFEDQDFDEDMGNTWKKWPGLRDDIGQTAMDDL